MVPLPGAFQSETVTLEPAPGILVDVVLFPSWACMGLHGPPQVLTAVHPHASACILIAQEGGPVLLVCGPNAERAALTIRGTISRVCDGARVAEAAARTLVMLKEGCGAQQAHGCGLLAERRGGMQSFGRPSLQAQHV